MSNRHAFPVGAKIKVAQEHAENATGNHHLPTPNHVYVVESCRTSMSGFQVRVEGRPEEFGTDWFVWAEAPARKPIPFSLTKQTSRDYAAHQTSHALEPDTNRVLDMAADGSEVDAVEFRKAVTAALSLAATRAGQSMGRRTYTKECRHLLYIVDAVIDNALAGLPPVDPGTKSPTLEKAKREVEEMKRALQIANETIDGLVAADNTVIVEARAAQQLRLDLDKANLEIGRLARINSRHALQMDYAMNLLTPAHHAQVIGFGDALNSVEA